METNHPCPESATGADDTPTALARVEPEHAPPFAPVPVAPRHDGWTATRQADFVDRLAETGCVDHAVRAVGMTRASAYRLRAHPDADEFRSAWDFALDHAVTELAHRATARAINGVVQPIFYRGEQVGERRHFDERLTMFILRTRMPDHYGLQAEKHGGINAFGEPIGFVRWFRDAILGHVASEPDPAMPRRSPARGKRR